MANEDFYAERVRPLVESRGPVLCLDIGSGTQDVLLALPGERPENWPQFVLPAPARRLAAAIAAETRAGRPVWLHGENMGGGFTKALREQQAAGLTPALTRSASAGVHDDPAKVEALGFTLRETCPDGATPLRTTDYDPDFWRTFLRHCALPEPALVLAAVQDHGCHADVGNREGRFRLWRQLLESSQGDPARWIFPSLPDGTPYTRLQALSRSTGGPVADTGAAAVLGLLAVPEVRRRSQRQGVTLINVGNSHVLAFLLYQERILGIYEQHTGMQDKEAFLADLKDFRLGWLPDELVRERGGHGVAFAGSLPPEAEGFMPTFILGPRRELLRGEGQFVAPRGDMMTAGCHGLLLGLALSSGV